MPLMSSSPPCVHFSCQFKDLPADGKSPNMVYPYEQLDISQSFTISGFITYENNLEMISNKSSLHLYFFQ